MKLEVEEDLCIGCGACVVTAPLVFDFNDNGLAKVIMSPIDKENLELAKEAMGNCPTDAIKEIK